MRVLCLVLCVQGCIVRTTTGAWAITLVNKGDRRQSRLDVFGDACIHSAAHSCNIAIKYRNMGVCAFVGMVFVGAVRHGRRFFFVRIRLTATLDSRFVRKLSLLGSNFMCIPWGTLVRYCRTGPLSSRQTLPLFALPRRGGRREAYQYINIIL